MELNLKNCCSIAVLSCGILYSQLQEEQFCAVFWIISAIVCQFMVGQLLTIKKECQLISRLFNFNHWLEGEQTDVINNLNRLRSQGLTHVQVSDAQRQSLLKLLEVMEGRITRSREDVRGRRKHCIIAYIIVILFFVLFVLCLYEILRCCYFLFYE